MSDYKTGLPVRSEQDADERLHSKIVDYTTPSQGMEVDTDGNAHAEMHGNDPGGTDRVVRTSELGALTPDGVYHASNNTKPGNTGIVVAERNATPGDAQQTKRVTGVSNSDVHAADIALHDEDGVPYSPSNPLPVKLSEAADGDEIHDYNTAAAVAAAGTSNHDYTVTALKTLELKKVMAAASARSKAELQIETGAATGIFTTRAVKFGSVALPNMDFDFPVPIIVAAGVKVRVIRTNLDNQSQDLYSTIIGQEV